MAGPLFLTPNGRWLPEGPDIPASKSDRFEGLMAAARAVRENAYAPYSKFRVGAAVFMDGEIAVGCNVENASYGGTICAERSAIFSAVASGHRTLEMIAISTDACDEAAIESRSPCGFCRQVMSEFATPETLVLLDAGSTDEVSFVGNVISFEALLPWRFRLEKES